MPKETKIPIDSSGDAVAMCCHCDEEISKEVGNYVYRHQTLCEDCYESDYCTCDDCNDVVLSDDVVAVGNRGKYICSNCYNDNYGECCNCNTVFPNDDLHENSGDYYCDSCDRDIQSVCRDYDNSDDNIHMSLDNGHIVDSKRIFSAEIECNYPDFDTMKTTARELPEAMGIHEDGSLNNEGIEIVTPKLRGKKGEKLLTDVCTILKDNNFDVDSSCGLHIHLDASDIIRKQGDDEKDDDYTSDINIAPLRSLMLLYIVFEPVIMSFLPQSRRNNRYCYPLVEFYHIREIMDACNIDDFESIWYREASRSTRKSRKSEKYDSSRYAGINFHSLLGNNNLEIRYHSGTMDSTKILSWISLHCHMMDIVKSKRIYDETLLQTNTLATLTEKTKEFFHLVEVDKKTESYFRARQKQFCSSIDDEEKLLCVE